MDTGAVQRQSINVLRYMTDIVHNTRDVQLCYVVDTLGTKFMQIANQLHKNKATHQVNTQCMALSSVVSSILMGESWTSPRVLDVHIPVISGYYPKQCYTACVPGRIIAHTRSKKNSQPQNFLA